MVLANLAIGGALITANVLIWWTFYTFVMGMGAFIGWPLLITCYAFVLYLTIKNLGNSLCILQTIIMTIICLTFLFVKIF